MNEKKISQRIILICFAVLCLSWVLWIPMRHFVDSENYENRELVERPSLTAENYETFPKEFEAYINDNLPFRNQLIQLGSAIDYFIFDTSSSSSVLIGRDDWLFYSKEDDGDPVGCYKGTNTISDKKLEKIAQNCVRQRDWLQAQGKEFVIFIAPNKERVYSEKMPSYMGEPAETYKALQIYNYLTENTDLRVVYPYDEIMAAKEQLKENIYYKTDTHWNYIGGYVGASALLEELGVSMPEIGSDDIRIVKNGNTSGDLAGMLNLKERLKDVDCEYTIEGIDLHDREDVAYDFNEAIVYRATNADPRRLYVVRDSFSSHMAAYLGSQFDNSYLRYWQTYTYEDLAAQDPDVVVYEVAERYVGRLKKFDLQSNEKKSGE